MKKRIIAMLLAVAMLLSLIPAAAAEEGPVTELTAQEVENVSRFEEETEAEYPEEEMVTVIVELEQAPVLEEVTLRPTTRGSVGEAVSQFLTTAQATARKDQLLSEQAEVEKALTKALPEERLEVLSSWTNLVNGMALRVPYSALAKIRETAGVKRAYVEHTYDLPRETQSIGSEDAFYGYSYDMVGLEETWAAGYTGKNMLVAVFDTGLDLSWSYWNDGAENYIGVRHVHEAFTEDSFRSEDAKDELRYSEEAMAQFLESNTIYANSQFNKNDGIYKNSKVPFAYDYAGTIDDTTGMVYGDVNVYPGLGGSEHGTHVAGTVAGYAQTEEGEVLFSGVAPDAQLMIMKIFPDDGGSAREVCILNALEDAVALGADVLNMSFGSDNGFAMDDTAQCEAFARARELGILMMTSAGNADYSSSNNNYGGETLATNPETAMMSSPAIYPSNLAVASINNTINTRSVLTWYADGEEQGQVPFTDSTEIAMKYQFAGKDPVNMVLVEGYGTYSDYYNAGFRSYYGYGDTGASGIALVKRGELSFADKVTNAGQFMWSYYNTDLGYYVTENPVKAVIVYDNDPESTELITMSTGDYTSVTAAFISGVDGAAIAEALAGGKTVTMTVEQEDRLVDFPQGGEMSEFTSWGAGPSLELKPEITAPGGNIYSAVFDQGYNYNTYGQFTDYTGSYAMMSGTSMAAPHMTGITALVEQYLRQGREMTDRKEIADLAAQLLVSTAVPQMETEEAFYSPRIQGAGLVNVAAAITTPAYISVEGQPVGKLELKDDPRMQGSYPLSFEVTNMSEEDVTYTASAYVQRPAGGDGTMSYTDVLLAQVELGMVTVPAGQTVTVSGTVTLTDAQKEEMRTLFANGCYVEGYVTLTGETAVTIGLPFLAFFGDWTKAPIFDSALWFDTPEDGDSVWNNECTWEVSDIGSLEPGSGIPVLLGQNYFDPTSVGAAQKVFHPENFAISPNGDGVLDAIDIFELYQLRQARAVIVQVRDAETDQLYYSDFVDYLSMSTYQPSYGVAFPWSLSYFTPTNWAGTDLEGNLLPSGTGCVMTITALGDGDYGETVYVEEAGRFVTNFFDIDPADPATLPTFNGHAMDLVGNVISFPVTVDTVAPKLVNNAVSFYEKDGRVYITGTVEDADGSIASVEVHPYVARSYQSGYGDPSYVQYGMDEINPFYSNHVYDAATKTLTFTADVTEYAHTNESFSGENYYYKYEWTGNVILSCGDYGINDRTYVIHVDSSEGLILSQTSALLHVGDSFDLSVNDNTGMNAPIVRTSDNEAVATVDEFGRVTAVAPGQAIITVSNGYASVICIVAVEEYPTEVVDFNLSITNFDGLKPDGALIVQVTDLQPADVQITENRWEVFEDDEDWAGLLNVEKYTSDGKTGMVYLNYAYSEDLIPSGTGHLDVTLNGVTRTMTFSWEDIYRSSTDDGLVTDTSWQGEQTYYVTQGETATIVAKYRNSSEHSAAMVRLYTAVGASNYSYDNPIAPAVGLTLDGPPTYHNGGTWNGKIVNQEGYALPESIKVFTHYDYGYEYEATLGFSYGVYFEYDPATGVITVYNAPYGATNELVIRADGVEAPGNPAGVLSGDVYELPDGLYGPFDWTAAEGTAFTGELTTAENVSTESGTNKNVAYYTPSEPGVTYLTAASKDGAYSINVAVICLPVKAESLKVENRHVSLHMGETETLTTVMEPMPTLEKDQKLIWTSFNEAVVTVDENGVLTPVSGGNAYIKVVTATDTTVMSYALVEVTDHEASDWVVDQEATCTADGSCHTACTVCGETLETSVITATGHMWDGGKVTTEPTAFTAGQRIFTCTVCGETRTETVPATKDYKMPFVDVPEGEYYYIPVAWAVEKQVTKGVDATHFAPEEGCTRGQVVTFLWRAAGSPKADNTVPFTDVKSGDYCYEAVAWAVEQGVTKGTSATTFSPDEVCTRGQVMTFLYRYHSEPKVSGSCVFTDVAQSEYYYNAVLWAVQEEITKGTSATAFSPDETCTRGQIVTFLYRDFAK